MQDWKWYDAVDVNSRRCVEWWRTVEFNFDKPLILPLSNLSSMFMKYVWSINNKGPTGTQSNIFLHFPLEAKLNLPSHLIALCKIEQKEKSVLLPNNPRLLCQSFCFQTTRAQYVFFRLIASICFGAFCSVLAYDRTKKIQKFMSFVL